MKILYLDPTIKSSTSQNYKYYDGVYDELIKICQVHLCREPVTNLYDYISKTNFQPDAVVFGLGWFNHGYFGVVKNLNVPSVCILFKPQNNLRDKLKFCIYNNINRILTPIPQYKKYEKATGIKTELFPYGFDPEIFKSREIEKEYDIGFSGALHENKHYPTGAFKTKNLRTKIGEALQQEDNLDVFWYSSDDRPSRIPSYEQYAKVINSSHAWIATAAAFGDITPRYYEVAASNTLLLCQRVEREYEHIFTDGINCVQFDPDLNNFANVVKWIKNNPIEVSKITTTATQDFLTNHTWENRAKKLIQTIQGIL
jgi:glycosyltransferase involved in cell wall biosynthesis